MWFTKTGRFRALAREATAGRTRTKMFEAFQEWIVENEGELWSRITERANNDDEPPF